MPCDDLDCFSRGFPVFFAKHISKLLQNDLYFACLVSANEGVLFMIFFDTCSNFSFDMFFFSSEWNVLLRFGFISSRSTSPISGVDLGALGLKMNNIHFTGHQRLRIKLI